MWSRAQAENQSARNIRRIHDLQQSLIAYDQDRRRAARQAQQQCRACFYVHRRIGGNALTPFTCTACGQTAIAATTAIPCLCSDCAHTQAWCAICGAVMD